jgi:2'-5' RNA ligase superfamily
MSDRQATETAVLVAVPEVEAAVARHRTRLDSAASRGVPAHVTVLYPFVHPDELDDVVRERLAGAVLSVPAFGCLFARTAWFAEDLLWLAPEPDDPFRRLTDAVFRAFPECPPYAGAHGDAPDPHLTIGDLTLGTVADLKAAEADVRTNLPLYARVDHVLLMAGAPSPDSWHVVGDFPLGP